MKRTPLRRSKCLARVGARATRDSEELEVFRTLVLARAQHRCERCGVPHSERWLHAHHMLPRGRGGKNEILNGAALCSGENGCHAQVHDHRADDWQDFIVTTKPVAEVGK